MKMEGIEIHGDKSCLTISTEKWQNKSDHKLHGYYQSYWTWLDDQVGKAVHTSFLFCFIWNQLGYF